jgi:hypothetical protein
MPLVFRLMKSDGDRPSIGTASMMLGVRPDDRDIPVLPDGTVAPGTGGLSVYAALRDLPARMIPRRLRGLIPKATGSDKLCVWAMGEGPFAPGGIAPKLTLRVDPNDPRHGFIEPEVIMTLAEYQEVLAATQDQWVVDER